MRKSYEPRLHTDSGKTILASNVMSIEAFFFVENFERPCLGTSEGFGGGDMQDQPQRFQTVVQFWNSDGRDSL